MTDWQDCLELRFPSKLRYLATVDAVVQSFAAELALDADSVNNISTATIEAASNAIEHANQFDEKKWVLLRVRTVVDGVEVDVEDQGNGFDPRPYERELGPEDLLKLRGRGIFIMRSFMDSVRFTRLANGGMRVRLHKTIKASLDETDQQVVREN